MKTRFSAERLADPDIAAADRILRACVHCGYCTATCPTYVLLGDELDSPRGRIYLIRDMLEQDQTPTAAVVKHIDRCLSCLSCMTTCPSGVDYMHLVDLARVRIERRYRRPFSERALRFLLAWGLSSPVRARFGMWLGRQMKPLVAILPHPAAPSATPGLMRRLRAMLALVPPRLPRLPPPGRVFTARGRRRGRVALVQGCVAQVLAPRITRAAISLLTRHGIEVVLVKDEQCCGALSYHMGRENGARAAARANVAVWCAEARTRGLDAILVTASGCGTVIKDYGHLLRHDGDCAADAAEVAELAKDITEYVAGLELEPVMRHPELVIAYHSSCSLQHGQKVAHVPKDLLSKCGFIVKDVPESHLCCGSAGTYNILQPELADRLRDRKIANIASVKPDMIAAGNIGCMVQIAGSAMQIPVVHTIELLDWATGGLPPANDQRIRAVDGQ
ncbi:MAG: glycolate oxidase subunit GlcF [Alphaproteobacteria bacterium]|nr:glycolate oxidase subunit GlcF [Alphaproteobacteria bacterium]